MPGMLGGEAQVIKDVEIGGVSVQGAGKGVFSLRIALPVGKGHAKGEGHTRVVSGFTLDFSEEILGGLILTG